MKSSLDPGWITQEEPRWRDYLGDPLWFQTGKYADWCSMAYIEAALAVFGVSKNEATSTWCSSHVYAHVLPRQKPGKFRQEVKGSDGVTARIGNDLAIEFLKYYVKCAITYSRRHPNENEKPMPVPGGGPGSGGGIPGLTEAPLVAGELEEGGRETFERRNARTMYQALAGIVAVLRSLDPTMLAILRRHFRDHQTFDEIAEQMNLINPKSNEPIVRSTLTRRVDKALAPLRNLIAALRDEMLVSGEFTMQEVTQERPQKILYEPALWNAVDSMDMDATEDRP